MEITEVRVKLVDHSSERLRAFCSVTFDGDFVIRDLKVIDGLSGVFVAMPSRKLADRCTKCGSKNHLRARFCNECGQRLNENRAPKDPDGRAKLHADIAHPINADCRERIQTAVVKAYEEELEKSKSPDYKPISFDDFDDDYEGQDQGAASAKPSAHREEPEATEEPVEEEVEAKQSRQDRGRDRHDRGRDRGGDRGAKRGRGDDRPKRETSADQAGESLGDYNELIADLKREAAARQDTRRGGREDFSRRERRETPAGDSDRAPASAAEEPGRTGETEDQGDFGAGVQPAGQERRRDERRGPRSPRDASARGRDARVQGSHGDRAKAPRDSERRDEREHEKHQEGSASVEAEEESVPQRQPEPPQPEPKPTPDAPPAQEDDDFGAGLL